MVRWTAVLCLGALAACGDPAADPGPDAEPPPPPECGPGAGGPYALVEGETVSITLTCTVDGEVRDGDEFTITALPAGAVYDPASATMTWTPALDQAAVYELVL